MRGGILIIGSLLWGSQEREEWRRSRLCVDQKVCVKAPIRYGRRSHSWGNTFTMTFAPDRPGGQAVLVPCKAAIVDVAALVAEAEALWKAEQRNASPGTISGSWGCVGVLFNIATEPAGWLRAWADHFRFRANASPILPVDEDGVLRIPWPTTTLEGAPAGVDMILATATRAEATCPSAEDIADAWLVQNNGNERYFFENVRHGIRTPEDLLIWRRIEVRRPHWLGSDAYTEAIAILRGEAGQCV